MLFFATHLSHRCQMAHKVYSISVMWLGDLMGKYRLIKVMLRMLYHTWIAPFSFLSLPAISAISPWDPHIPVSPGGPTAARLSWLPR